MIAASSTSFQPTMVFSIGSSKCPRVEYAATPPTATSKALRAQAVGIAARVGLDEIAAIGHASDDRKAPLLGIDRELRRRDDIPYDVGAADIRVTSIAAVVRQLKVVAGEVAYRGDRFELRTQCRRRRGTVDDIAGDGLALRHERELAFGAFKKVAAAAQERDHANRRSRAECGGTCC